MLDEDYNSVPIYNGTFERDFDENDFEPRIEEEEEEENEFGY